MESVFNKKKSVVESVDATTSILIYKTHNHHKNNKKIYREYIIH